MSTASDQLGKQAQNVADNLHAMGGAVRDAAQEKLDQVGEKAAEYYEEGREKVHGIACSCEQFLQQRPLTSVLIAAGVGLLLGMYLKRR